MVRSRAGYAAACLSVALTGCAPAEPLSGDEIPDVGWTADLVEYFHDVGGSAEIVAEDTIELTGFTYDATGVDTRFFLERAGEPFTGAIELTDNLVREGQPYDGEDLTLTIPQGAEAGTWNLLTLWCVPFETSFGDGEFFSP